MSRSRTCPYAGAMQDESQSGQSHSNSDTQALRQEFEQLKRDQAVFAATSSGRQSTQAAMTTGAHAVQAAAMAGTWATIAAGFGALIIGIVLGANLKR